MIRKAFIFLPCALALAMACGTAMPVMAQNKGNPTPPTAAEEWPSIEGKWHMLMAHEADKNLVDRPEYKKSVVTISDKQLQWIAADGKPLFSAACTWNQVASPHWQVDVTPEGGAPEGATLPGIATLFDKDILKISWRRKNLEKGRPTLFNGGAEQAYLLLSRRPLGSPPAKPDLAGEWQMLTVLDDANDKFGRGRGTSVAVFEADTFAWKPNKQSVKYAGGYVLDPSTQPLRIKLNVTNPPPGSGATPTPRDGFVAGVVEFLDEDTVQLCFRESGWRDSDPRESRYPKGFYSDGDMNMWIFRRPKP
jgi:uncharacterized protein (TIGR03067 family)